MEPTFSPKCLIFALAVLISMLCLSNAPSHASSNNPFELYPNNIEFQIKRNGRDVGSHTVSFSKTDESIIRVNVEMNLKIRFLGIPFYSYRYNSEGHWRDNTLVRLEVEQEDDGVISRTNVLKQDEFLQIEGPAGMAKSPLNTFPTNHWHAGVLKASRIINTLNGTISNVDIRNVADEIIRAEGKDITAKKYVYSGDFETQVWYDSHGRWVKMQFLGRDGSKIEYECIRCGLSGVKSKQRPYLK